MIGRDRDHGDVGRPTACTCLDVHHEGTKIRIFEGGFGGDHFSSLPSLRLTPSRILKISCQAALAAILHTGFSAECHGHVRLDTFRYVI